MNKLFIIFLFVFNMVYFNQALASLQVDQGVIYNEETTPEEGKDEEGKDEEKDPEDECE